MHNLYNQATQLVKLLVIETNTMTEDKVDSTNTEVFNNTVENLTTFPSRDDVVNTFNDEYRKYCVANNIKLPGSTEPNKEYYFAMIPEEDVGDDAMFHVVEKEYFEREGYVDDRHIMDSLLSNLEFPEAFETEFDEACESMFEAMNMNRKDTLEYLSNIKNFTLNNDIL